MAVQALQNQFAPEAVDPKDNFQIPSKRGLLSAAEIEALLRPDVPEPQTLPAEQPVPCEAYQLAESADADDDVQLKEDADHLASRLTLALRSACRVDAATRVTRAVQVPLSELADCHVNAFILILFGNAAGMQVAALTLDEKVAIRIIDQACGGDATVSVSRALTHLDVAILSEILTPIAAMLDPSFTVTCVEMETSAAFALLPPGKAMLAEMICEVGGQPGKAAYARLVDPPRPSIESHKAVTDGGHFQTIVTARLASLTVPISRLNDLKPGAFLLLGVPTDQPIELLAGDHRADVVAEGRIGRKGYKVAIKVTNRIGVKTS